MKPALRCACLCATVSACSDSTPVTGWPFDPIEFFTGHTRGDARLHTIVGSARQVRVDSVGTPDSRGGLVLVQTIAEQAHPPRVRRWTLHPAGDNRWTGALTDAAGAVTVTRTSEDVTIAYRMHDGSAVEQHLQRPPNRPVENHMTVKRFDVRIASLDEQIRKVGS